MGKAYHGVPAAAAAALRFVAENEIARTADPGRFGMDRFGVFDPIKEISPDGKTVAILYVRGNNNCCEDKCGFVRLADRGNKKAAAGRSGPPGSAAVRKLPQATALCTLLWLSLGLLAVRFAFCHFF